jgi:cytochrome c oxidase subunit III
VRLQPALAGHRVIDVSTLPDQGEFGHRGLIWWGTVGYMVIEGSMLVMALITYFYLRLRVQDWPPSLPDPDLRYGTVNLMILLASAIPNHLAKIAGESFSQAKTRFWLVICVLFGIALLVVRWYEFIGVRCRWDDNAYGSMVWCLLVLHTIHLATEVVDTGVLTALVCAGPISRKRYIDVSENGLYWYFVVAWWIPIYMTIYFAPRWL